MLRKRGGKPFCDNSAKKAFINKVTQIWTIFITPSPYAMRLFPRPYALLTQNALPSPSLHDVIMKDHYEVTNGERD